MFVVSFNVHDRVGELIAADFGEAGLALAGSSYQGWVRIDKVYYRRQNW
jgi:hypothetical protein